MTVLKNDERNAIENAGKKNKGKNDSGGWISTTATTDFKKLKKDYFKNKDKTDNKEKTKSTGFDLGQFGLGNGSVRKNKKEEKKKVLGFDGLKT